MEEKNYSSYILLGAEAFDQLFWPECHTQGIPFVYPHITATNMS